MLAASKSIRNLPIPSACFLTIQHFSDSWTVSPGSHKTSSLRLGYFPFDRDIYVHTYIYEHFTGPVTWPGKVFFGSSISKRDFYIITPPSLIYNRSYTVTPIVPKKRGLLLLRKTLSTDLLTGNFTYDPNKRNKKKLKNIVLHFFYWLS